MEGGKEAATIVKLTYFITTLLTHFVGFMPGSSPGGSREFEGETASVRRDLFI